LYKKQQNWSTRHGKKYDYDELVDIADNHGKVRKLNAKSDSYVVKTNVHFPTDINLLLDAMRKIILGMAYISGLLNYSAPWSKKH